MKKALLVSCSELEANPEWRVFDCRHNLADPKAGKAIYDQGHIPGALHAHLDWDLAGEKTGSNGRHPLPTPEDFIAWLSQSGINPDDMIVAYDDVGGSFAARLWWLLRWIGHESAAVLDGGYPAWVNTDRAITEVEPKFPATDYPATDIGSVNTQLSVDVSDVEANIETQQYLVIDARAANRYAGREEPADPVAGHIPHAINRPNSKNLTAEGYFKSAQELNGEFQSLIGTVPPDQIIHQCGSGITACHNLLAMEVAGLHDSRLYPGSWSEWCSDPKRGVVTE